MDSAVGRVPCCSSLSQCWYWQECMRILLPELIGEGVHASCSDLKGEQLGQKVVCIVAAEGTWD